MQNSFDDPILVLVEVFVEQDLAESSALTRDLLWRSGCSLGDAHDTVLLSEFLRARSEPAALQSAVTAACARSPKPPDKAEGSGPWPAAKGELMESMLPRGHMLDMLGLQDETSAHPAPSLLTAHWECAEPFAASRPHSARRAY